MKTKTQAQQLFALIDQKNSLEIELKIERKLKEIFNYKLCMIEGVLDDHDISKSARLSAIVKIIE